MRNIYALVLLVLVSCGGKSTETGIATDSLKTDSLIRETAAATPQGPGVRVDSLLADSLINHPLAVYHGEYALRSSSSAEQARLTLQFVGNNTFVFFLDYQVADFCGATQSGKFTMDNMTTGTYNLAGTRREGDSDDSKNTRPLIFTLADRNVQLADPKGEFGVGQCQFSGDFVHCDGPCGEISWEGFGEDSGEGDEQDPNDSTPQH
jgi:hypothetical protein